MRYYTTNIISANLELTPEGYLLAKNVPIARTGSMTYLGEELIDENGKPVVTPVAGLVRIDRTADEVFRPETIASFEGKAVTLNHPSEDVGPTNWPTLAKGVVQNVHRGEGLDDDLLMADLLVTEGQAIGEVRGGLREVSCGYEAEYEEIEPGRGRQKNIVGNHVALVEKGRCGTRCAIGDSMKKPKWMDRLRAAFKNRDEAELEEALKESTGDEAAETEEEKKKREEEESKKSTSDALARVTDSLVALGSRLAALEAKRTKDEEAEESDEEKKKREDEEKEKESKTSDSAALTVETQEVFSRSEILAPGLKFPTYDAVLGVSVRDHLCNTRRQALAAAYANAETRDAVAPLLAGVDLKKLTCDALQATFVGASEIVRRANNAQSRGTARDSKPVADSVASSVSSINRRNAEFWKERK